MLTFRDISLGRKFTLIIMIASSATLLLASTALAGYDLLSFRQAMAQDLATVAALAGENSKAALILGDTKAAADVLQALQAEPHVVVASIYAPDGKVFAEYIRRGMAPRFVSPPEAEGTKFAAGRLIELHRIRLANETLGSIYIESDLDEMNDRLSRYIKIVILVVSLSFLIAFLLASGLQRLISRPILELVGTTQRISSENNYALRAKSYGGDELGLLVSRFNEMLAQIQQRDQELERQRADLQKEVAIRTTMNQQLEAAKEAAESASHAKREFLADSLRESSPKLRVLVAEDNAVNQALIVRFLAKMGHVSVVAGNGKEALLMATNQKFDLVFMDVQMPEMDGFLATAAIRDSEAGTGGHLPIFAMTAYAMKEDRERCLDAGMDGYITKPVRFSDVEQTLANLTISQTLKPMLSESSIPEQSILRPSSWGKAEALDRLGGDEKLLVELCQIFLKESPKLTAKLRKSILDGDAEAMQRAAHSLKGEVSYLAAPGATQAARRLEDMGHDKDLSHAGEVLAVLERELEYLVHAIQEFSGVSQ